MTDIFGADIPFVRFCGIEPIDCAPGRSHLEVTIEPHHANQMGVAHGGLLMTLLDVAMGSAARLAAGANVITVDLQTAFLAPAAGRLAGRGRVVRAGKSLLFVEGEVTDAAGELVARGSSVFKTAAPPKRAP
ncbi:MAG: PaaI family thioesterase [Hyphomicrobiales bacterium]|nr:PaaI family thioesterase [Hyphomicrobiales bacterium]